MFVSRFVDPDLRVEIFFGKKGAAENGGVDFEIGDIGNSAHLCGGWRIFQAKPIFSALILFFLW